MTARAVDETPCPCRECTVANHGRPAVKFGGAYGRPGYEWHGTRARDFYEAQARGLAFVRDLMAKRQAEKAEAGA